MNTVLTASRLSRSYPGEGSPVRAVDEVDLVLVRSESVSVMGPSGCGKSTLLHLLGGLERPLQPSRALADRQLADEVLGQGIHNALAVLNAIPQR